MWNKSRFEYCIYFSVQKFSKNSPTVLKSTWCFCLSKYCKIWSAYFKLNNCFPMIVKKNSRIIKSRLSSIMEPPITIKAWLSLNKKIIKQFNCSRQKTSSENIPKVKSPYHLPSNQCFEIDMQFVFLKIYLIFEFTVPK